MLTRRFSLNCKDREMPEYQQAFREIQKELGDDFVDYKHARLIDERCERIIEMKQAQQQKELVENSEKQIECYQQLVDSYKSDEKSYKKIFDLKDDIIRIQQLQVEAMERQLLLLRLRPQTFLFPIL